MEQLEACYERYVTEAEAVWKNRPAWDGALGLRSSVKDHPCHMAFYESVAAWTDAFLKGNPTQSQAEEAVYFVLTTSQAYRNRFVYWTMFAAHGLMRPLIDLVSPQFACRMRVWYREHYPRPEHLPVHKDLLKRLKKREKE